MNFEVFISCAVTGSGDTVGKHPSIPVTPKQIAHAALEAARAGAAIAHCHVRDPETGAGSRDPALYREVVARIRESDTDVIINLTSGMGGDLASGPPLALAAVKAVVRETEMLSNEECYALMRSGKLAAFEAMLASEDAKEGPRAFAEKREPVWQGK